MPSARPNVERILRILALSCVCLLPSTIRAQSLFVSNVSMAEGHSGTTDFVFQVSLLPMSGDTVTVSYSISDITTTAGVDYVGDSGMVTFMPGQTSRPVAVQVNGDTDFESSEFFVLNLSDPVNATIQDGQGLGTIQNDDVRLSINNVSMAEGNAGTSDFIFTVSLDANYPLTIMVDYDTVDSTATLADNDYLAASGTLTFDPGVTSRPVTVQVNGDTVFEPTEAFLVQLSNPVNVSIQDGSGTGTIVNDDPRVSIGDVSMAEGDSGTTGFTFTVSLDEVSESTVMVDWTTMDGTATLADGDYAMNSGTVTFDPSDVSETVTVLVSGDTGFEPNETFTVVLSNPINTAINDGTGTGTIQNDDVRIAIGNVSQAEGDSGTSDFVFTVSLTPAVAKLIPITVEYQTQDSTATVADDDYVAASGTVTFMPGQTSRPLPVEVVGDTDPESSEFFIVNLSNPSGAGILDSQGLGTILNDDFSSFLSIDDVSQVEGDAGTTIFEFTVTLAPPSAGPVSAGFTTASGTAQATPPADYVPDFGTVLFDPGETAMPVSIEVNGDMLFEGDETFLVNLTSATGAGITDGQGVGTILNDEEDVTISVGDASVLEGDSSTVVLDFPLTLTGTSASTITFSFSTAASTASPGADYTPLSGQRTIMPGGAAGTIPITVIGDPDHEIDETLTVILTSPVNVTIVQGTAAGTILDDDAACSPVPAGVTDLSVELINAGTSLSFAWTDVPDADGYVLFRDGSGAGAFQMQAGMSTSGAIGITVPTPAGDAYFLLAGQNGTCGLGPRRPCAHDPCITGARLDSSCDLCVADICAVDPSCCGASWSATCVAAVSGVCGLSCP